MRPGPAFALVAALLTLPIIAPSAMANEICGAIWTGSHPVGGAQVLASAEGILTTTDSEGRFCLTGLAGKLQKIQILALGFHPAELWAHVDASDEALRIELVPLRIMQFGEQSGGPAGVEDGSLPPDPRLRQQMADAVALGHAADPVFLVLPADSLRAETSPDGPAAASLALLHDALLSGAPARDSSEAVRYWLDVADWARDLEAPCCGGNSDGTQIDCGNPDVVCAFLDRAVTTALARGYLSGDPAHAEELGRRIDGLSGAGDPELRDWARRLGERLDLPAQERR